MYPLLYCFLFRESYTFPSCRYGVARVSCNNLCTMTATRFLWRNNPMLAAVAHTSDIFSNYSYSFLNVSKNLSSGDGKLIPNSVAASACILFKKSVIASLFSFDELPTTHSVLPPMVT